MEGDEVEIRRRGKALVLTPKKRSWTQLAESLKKFTPDFMEKGRKQPLMQKRKRPSRSLSLRSKLQSSIERL